MPAQPLPSSADAGGGHEGGSASPSGDPVEMTRAGARSLAPREWVIARDPGDARLLLWFVLLTALGVFAARGAEQTTAGAEADLVQLVARLPDVVSASVVVAVQVAYVLLFLGIPLSLLILRRWRRWAVYTLGHVATTVLASRASGLVAPTGGGVHSDADLEQGQGWPPSTAVATSTTALVLLSPYLPRAWRRFGWLFVASLAVLRVATAEDLALDIVLALGIGGLVGAALLLGFGRKVPVPTEVGVLAGLDRVGLYALRVKPQLEGPLGPRAFRAHLPDDRVLHCKVLTARQYEADRLRRTYRRVRMRQIGEEVPFSTARRAAATEAMLSMSAARAGVRTPDVVGVAPLPGDDMLIAFADVPGCTLDLVPVDRMADDVLDQAWAALAALGGVGIAHRDLQLSSWILDETGRLWLIDFSYGEPAATADALSADVAELLAATYARVGAQRAVAAAVRGLGTAGVAEGISHLVPAALSRPTRAAVKARPDGLEPLVEEVCRACGIAEPAFAPIERVKPRTLVMGALLVVAVYVLLPQLADLPRMIEAIREADPRLVAAAAAASLVTYVGSGLAIVGSMPTPVRALHAMLAAIAATFAGAVAPPGVAHIGLNVRFAQRQGLPTSVAVSATAAKEVTVAAVHLALLIAMAIAAGSSGVLSDELDRLPSWQAVAIAVAVLLAIVGGAAAVPRLRRIVIDSVVPSVRHSVGAIRELLNSPTKMVVLFAGGLLLQLGYVAALYCSVRALGGDVPFLTIGLIYLTVGSAAAVAPTPGGVGAVEAVLLAALTGVGMAAAPALAAVFLYRLVTFWAPIPLGGLAMRVMLSRELL